MILTVGSRPNRNGNSRRVTFDTEKKCFYTDGRANISIDQHITVSEVKALVSRLKAEGYTERISF